MTRAKPSSDNDDIRPEYDFSKGVRGKHHLAYKAGTNVVLLDPDLAESFADSQAVNRALRQFLDLTKDRVVAKEPSAKRRAG